MMRSQSIPVTPVARLCWVSVAAVASALMLLVPAARSETSSVTWTAPTPADGARFVARPGKSVTFALNASTIDLVSIVHIAPAQPLPSGVKFNSSDGVTARATFSWRPERPGDYTLRFSASVVGATGAPVTLSYAVHVQGKVIAYPLAATLTNDKIARWAPVVKKVVVRAQPKGTGRAVTTLGTRTTDSDTQNLVLVLSSLQTNATETWYRVRLPMLPNNTLGWVPAAALGALYQVNTHLYVDRAHFRATLKRNSKVIFTTTVGVGRTIWPTPSGEFYIRSKLTNFNDPFYGPIAFGTSARSATLTDWPGGGFVGVHGTNQPEILPGRVSHGCIRMRNAAIRKLAALMPVGTPVTIT